MKNNLNSNNPVKKMNNFLEWLKTKIKNEHQIENDVFIRIMEKLN